MLNRKEPIKMKKNMSGEETIKVIRFSGKKEDWVYWESKFLARARRKKYLDVLRGTISPKTEEEFSKITKESEKALEEEIREKNAYALEDLLLSIQTDNSKGRIAASLVLSIKNEEYLDGHAHQAWTKLTKKYKPSSAPSLMRLKNEFQNEKLKENEDP